jgi:hypothetical protein
MPPSKTLTVEERREKWRNYRNEYNARQRETLKVVRSKRRDVLAFPKPVTLLKPTPDTNPMYWEAPDGWHGAYLVWRVGPCADYTAAAMALREAMTLSAWDIAFAVKP